MNKLLVVGVSVSLILTGCASGGFSGLSDSSAEFQCKAPQGMPCNSVSGIYANSMTSNLRGLGSEQNKTHPQQVQSEQADSQQSGVAVVPAKNEQASKMVGDIPTYFSNTKTKKIIAPPSSDSYKHAFSPVALTVPSSGDPIRLPPLVLRVWVAPWEDTDGDLHDESYFYAVINRGSWMIEANQEQIRDQFKPLYPLQSKSNHD
jgi:conjugal transfer pilus assembly protein TraV